MSKRAGLAAGLAILVSAGVAQAGVVYSYAFDQASYDLTPGVPLQVPIYFEESVDDGTPSRLATEGGLTTAGVLFQKVSLTGGFTVTGAAVNPAFDDALAASASFAPTLATIFGATVDPILVAPGDPVPTHGVEAELIDGRYRVLLGWVTVLANSPTTEPCTFQASLLDVASDMMTWDAFNGPEPTYRTLANETGVPVLASSVDFTATVPEPMLAGPLFACVGALSLRRRAAERARA